MQTTVNIQARQFIMRVFYVCISVELGIALLDFFLNYLQWLPIRSLRKIVNITREDGIGNWFTSTQTLAIAVLLFVIWYVERGWAKAGNTDIRQTNGWGILGCCFTYLALDDATKMHERLGTAGEILAEEHNASGVFDWFQSYSWHIVVLPVLCIMGLYILWFLWKQLQDKTSRMLMIAAFAVLAFAILMDYFEGLDLPAYSSYSAKHMMKLVEETLEMFGMTLFLVTFCRHLVRNKMRIVVNVKA